MRCVELQSERGRCVAIDPKMGKLAEAGRRVPPIRVQLVSYRGRDGLVACRQSWKTTGRP